jgi:hypothetical protein
MKERIAINKRDFLNINYKYNFIDAFQRPHESVAHPGVAQPDDIDEAKQKHYTYYQW